MKRILFVLFFNICVMSMFAQDIIVMRNATEVEAKVLTVGVNEISYKKWSYQEGPTYQIPKSDVFYIKYANGEKDMITPFEETKTETKNPENLTRGQYIHRILFNSYLELGCPFTDIEAGPSFNATFGARIYDYGFAGLTVGMDALFGTLGVYGFDGVYFPIMADLRGFWPVRPDLSPFFEFSFGACIMSDLGYTEYWSYYPIALARVRLEAGLEYKRLVLGLGYDCLAVAGSSFHMGYAKVGIRLGRMK